MPHRPNVGPFGVSEDIGTSERMIHLEGCNEGLPGVGKQCWHDSVVINPREGYGSCPVCVSVCLSVQNLNLGTGASRGLNEGTSE